ncbi:entericidin A/B family lipoprotein [Chthonobacter albigriseus]|nr:entericidin A/B family lipoprotein [Chthonobacter albigriseus]
MPKTFAAVAVVLVAAFTLAACDNTVRGVGRDMRETGDAVQDTANQ